MALLTPGQNNDVPGARPFDAWLSALIAEARERGFSDALIDQALKDLQPRPIVIERDRGQAELTLTFERYFQTRVTPQVIQRGRRLAEEHRALLSRIEQAYGVPPSILLAIWGLESRYGQNTGITPVFQALATLAWEPRRSDFFRGQLFNALMMVSRGYIDVSTMTGSWAGAMGQPQFMPSSYLQYAVDFDEDGRRDIWRSTPDTLASIANYLSGRWTSGQIWGREVLITPSVRTHIEETVARRGEGCSAMRDMT
jgi:membrane-bound lytic murein transglycosylase B